MSKVKIMDRVEVEWVDSLCGTGRWIWLKDLDWKDYKKKYVHQTVGYVVGNETEFLALAQSRQVYEYEDGDRSISDPFVIPWRVVHKVTKL